MSQEPDVVQAPSQCPKCDGAMQQGFILDSTYGGQVASRWAAGVPQKSFWTGIKHVSAGHVIPITAFRCASCGYLESYARQDIAAK